jgi:hypothetical protein
VALAAIRGDKTLAELSERVDVHLHQITEWQKQPLEVPLLFSCLQSVQQIAEAPGAGGPAGGSGGNGR